MVLKDLIYISIFISSIVGSFFAFRYRVKRVEDNYLTIKNIIFLDKGGLNIVTAQVLEREISKLQKNIDVEAGVNAKALDKLESLSDNVLIIMTHMNIPLKLKGGK